MGSGIPKIVIALSKIDNPEASCVKDQLTGRLTLPRSAFWRQMPCKFRKSSGDDLPNFVFVGPRTQREEGENYSVLLGVSEAIGATVPIPSIFSFADFGV
jgi:hypothetical protein